MKSKKNDIKKLIKKRIDYNLSKYTFLENKRTKSQFDNNHDIIQKEILKSTIINDFKPNKLDQPQKINNLVDIQPIIEKKEPISIIITAYQTQDYIEECLDSIENQTYFINNDNFEILIGVDNCQDTLNKLTQICHKYRNLRIFMMHSNKGTYVTSNTLLNLVKFENIIRFDSDDIMKIEMINEIMLYSNNFDIIQFQFSEFNNDINIYNDSFKYVAAGAIFFKKSTMKLAGGYRNWKCAADSEFIKRISNRVKIYQLKKRLFYRRNHSNNLTNKIETGAKSDLRKEYVKLIKTYGVTENIKINKEINDYNEIIKSPDVIYEIQYNSNIKKRKKMIDIVIPHSNIDTYRTRNLHSVVKYYKEYLPDSNIILVEQNTETNISEIYNMVNIHLKLKMKENLFCKSFLLNEGYNLCRNKYVIFGDTDCFVHREILIRFNDLFPILNHKMILPYNRPVFNLTETQTINLINNNKNFNYNDLSLIRRGCFSNGGVVIIGSENYYKIGGHDPRFVGWGGEDDAFFIKCNKTIGVERLNYDLLHLNHPKGSYDGNNNPNYPNNLNYYNEYLTGDNNLIINKIGFNHLKKW